MKNKKLLLAAIAEDCKLRFRYINNAGETCAIGKLALLAGVSEETLRAAGKTTIMSREPGDDVLVDPIRDKIYEKFGLDECHLALIQELNDEIIFLKERRVQILGYLKGLTTD